MLDQDKFSVYLDYHFKTATFLWWKQKKKQEGVKYYIPTNKFREKTCKRDKVFSTNSPSNKKPGCPKTSQNQNMVNSISMLINKPLTELDVKYLMTSFINILAKALCRQYPAKTVSEDQVNQEH